MDQPFIAAAAQISPVFIKKKESIEKYAESLYDAGRQGVDLVVTPETGIPTYPYWRNNFDYTNPEGAQLWKDTVVSFYDQDLMPPLDTVSTLCYEAEPRIARTVPKHERDAVTRFA